MILNSTIEVDKIARFSAGTTITGVLICADNCYFDGKMHGNIETENKLVLGKNSEVLGTVCAGDLMAKGKINGDIKVQRRAIYCSSSIITAGSVQTNFLEVECGAVLNLNNLSMRLNELPESAFAALSADSSIAEDRIKMRKMDKGTNTKAKAAFGSTNNNDDQLLFQFFHNKEDK